MTDGRRDLQFQYNLINLPTVTETLESIAHDEGRFVALSASPGTTTAQFSDPALAILEQDDYMPSGIRVNLGALMERIIYHQIEMAIMVVFGRWQRKNTN